MSAATHQQHPHGFQVYGTPEIRCDSCGGTGVDLEKTHLVSNGHVRCWMCNGNGIDPAKTFQWSEPAPAKGAS